MNREIKFRVWDIDSQKMISLGELLCWEHGYTNTNFTAINKSITSLHRDIFSTDNNAWIKESKTRFILQQFTGLFDKNGREIYEGDILKEDQYCMNREIDLSTYNTFLIKFGNHAVGHTQGRSSDAYSRDMYLGAIFYLEPLKIMRGPKVGGLINIGEMFRIEIIGNLFENSELLEDTCNKN